MTLEELRSIRSKRTKTKRKDEEHEEQVAFVEFLDLQNIKYAAVPNGMFMNLKGSAAGKHMNYLKAEGFSPGFVDIIIFVGNGISLYIEMKKQKGGRVSPEQKEWHEWLDSNGYKAFICNGSMEAIKVVKKYIQKKQIENEKQSNIFDFIGGDDDN